MSDWLSDYLLWKDENQDTWEPPEIEPSDGTTEQ